MVVINSKGRRYDGEMTNYQLVIPLQFTDRTYLQTVIILISNQDTFMQTNTSPEFLPLPYYPSDGRQDYLEQTVPMTRSAYSIL